MNAIKLFCMVCIMASLGAVIHAQTSDWTWATKAGGISIDDAAAITVDDAGNSFVTGYFLGTAIFGTYSLTSSGSYDIYIAKMDPDGNWLWANRAGGAGSDQGAGITLDSVGNVYVTGSFSSNPASFGTLSLSSTGTANDIFVTKLNTNGTWIWAVKAGARYIDNGVGVAVDDDFNVYVTGSILHYGIFGNLPYLYTNGQSDCFVAKLSSNGSWLWARIAGGSYNESARGISRGSDGNIYLTGSFTSPTATFGSLSLTNAGGNSQSMDVFVAKINPSGTWLWATSAGGAGTDVAYSIATDGNSGIYLSGTKQLTASFGPDITLSAYDGYDVFVAKMDLGGNWLWAVRAGGTLDDFGWGLTVDNDYVYATGEFKSIALFGTMSLTSFSSATSDVYFAKLSAISGDWISVERVGNTGNDIGKGVALGPNGSMYWFGNFFGNIVFDSDTSLTSTSNGQDIYLAINSYTLVEPEISEVVVNNGSTEQLVANLTYPIEWDAAGLSQVMLDYGIIDNNNVVTWYPIQSTPVDATLANFPWTAPQVTCNASKVRVRSIDSNIQAESSQVLSIYEPIQLYGTFGSTSSPGGFLNTTTQPINWYVKDSSIVTQVYLKYSIDAGETWLPITDAPVASNMGCSPGGYAWDLPNINSNLVKIKIESASNENHYCRSQVFSILDAISLQSFTGGDAYAVASTENVMWVTADPQVQQVALDYSLDAGNSWLPIASSVPSTLESYRWELPNVASQTARVRVRDAINNNVFAESADNFAIIYPPAAPQGLQVGASPANPHDLQITWNSVTTDIADGPIVPTGYRVYFSSEPSDDPMDYSYLTTVTDGTSCIHQGALLYFDRLFYKVIAIKN